MWNKHTYFTVLWKYDEDRAMLTSQTLNIEVENFQVDINEVNNSHNEELQCDQRRWCDSHVALLARYLNLLVLTGIWPSNMRLVRSRILVTKSSINY